MKKNLYFVIILVLVMTSILVACGSQAASSPSTAPSSDAVQACLSQSGTTTVAQVEALISEKLQGHHDTARIFNAQHTREEWNATLDRMIGYGAVISDAEKQVLIDYLMCLHP